MGTDNVLLVKYGEIALRKGNRGYHERELMRIIKKSINDADYNVLGEQGRFLVESVSGNFDYDRVIPRVVNIFGLLGVCECLRLGEQSIENVRLEALAYMRAHFSEREYSFKVETARGNKNYPMLSNDVSADVGGYILEHMGNLRVDVHNPDIRLKIEIRRGTYIYSDKAIVSGWGGLPRGSSGKATLLLSGGFDSPVAGFLTAKRGVEIEAVYFHSPPYVSARAREKVVDIASALSKYMGKIKLHIVPFTDVQLRLREKTPPEKLVTLTKRAMLRTAQRIAEASGSMALVTGDSIGQVASQTLQSLYTIDAAATIPVLRPLAAMDKNEIIAIAEKIGTAEISALPYEDCCTVFVADHPEIRPKKKITESIEASIADLGELIDAAAANAEVVVVGD